MSGGFRARAKSGNQAKTPQGAPRRRSSTQQSSAQGSSRGPQQSSDRRAPSGRRDQRTPQQRSRTPRQLAVDILLECENGAYGNIAASQVLKGAGLDARDAAFVTEIAYGTLRAQGLLDAIIAECSDRQLSQLDREIRVIIRLGAYQLLRTNVSSYAAVDTAVQLVDDFGKTSAKGFVNAVLRSISKRDQSQWIEYLVDRHHYTPLHRLALTHSHPEWIAAELRDSLALTGAADELDAALAADDQRPKVHLVALPGNITAEELALISGGEVTDYSPYGVVLDGGDPAKLEPVRDRLAAVQDEGSQLIARAVTDAPLDGEDQGAWLDLCAGPGGKAAFIGTVAAIDGARVTAVEPVEHRAELVRKSCTGVPVDVIVADGRDSGLGANTFDRALVDAPCSGLGSLRRRPEARWSKQPSDIHDLVQLQQQLLRAAIDLVRPGGVIVYSTCSPAVAETVDIVQWALSTLPVEEMDTAALMPDQMDSVATSHGVQLWPHRHGTDAMYLCALRKTEKLG